MFDRLQQAVDQLDQCEGITPIDILALPPPLNKVVNKMMRRGALTLNELAADLKLKPAEAHQLGAMLVERGFLRVTEPAGGGEIIYKVRLARKSRKRRQGKSLDIWQKLDK